VWVLLVLTAAPLAVTVSSALSGAGWDAQGSTAQTVRQELRRDFPALGAEAAVVVYTQATPIATDRAALAGLVQRLATSPGGASVMSSTVARRLSTLTSFYRYCQEEEIITRNPAVNLRRPKVNYEFRTLGLDRNELGAFLVQAGISSPRDHALAVLLAVNGLRISEALGADIDDLDYERGHRTLKIVRRAASGSPSPSRPALPGLSPSTSQTAPTGRSSLASTASGWTATPPIAP